LTSAQISASKVKIPNTKTKILIRQFFLIELKIKKEFISKPKNVGVRIRQPVGQLVEHLLLLPGLEMVAIYCPTLAGIGSAPT